MTAASHDISAPERCLLEGRLPDCLGYVRDSLGNSLDLIIRELTLPSDIRCALAYIDGISDSSLIHSSIIDSLLGVRHKSDAEELSKLERTELLNYFSSHILVAGDILLLVFCLSWHGDLRAVWSRSFARASFSFPGFFSCCLAS